MATLQWSDGSGSVTITYNGVGDGSISVSASANDGLDRECTIHVVGKVTKSAKVFQEGLREEIELADGQILECSNERIGFLKR